MKATEYEFTSDRRIYRTYLINGKWRVTMTENDEYFDREHSKEFMVNETGEFKWSDMPRWRTYMPNDPDDPFEDDGGGSEETAKYKLAEFDTPEEAQEEVAWYWIHENHDKKDDYFS